MYLVKHKTSGQLFAMKVLYKRRLREEGTRQIVRSIRDIFIRTDEHEVLRKIDNPFTAKFYYSFQSDLKLYFVIEYVEGGDLTQILGLKGKFREEWVRFYSAEIILSLEHLHKNNVIYRDLKARNIMLTKDGHIKLIDFGLAKTMDTAKAYTLCGTPNYVAPEVLTAKGYKKSVDWWSLVRVL